jgi:hypothetical protein
MTSLHVQLRHASFALLRARAHRTRAQRAAAQLPAQARARRRSVVAFNLVSLTPVLSLSSVQLQKFHLYIDRKTTRLQGVIFSIAVD